MGDHSPFFSRSSAHLVCSSPFTGNAGSPLCPIATFSPEFPAWRTLLARMRERPSSPLRHSSLQGRTEDFASSWMVRFFSPLTDGLVFFCEVGPVVPSHLKKRGSPSPPRRPACGRDRGFRTVDKGGPLYCQGQSLTHIQNVPLFFYILPDVSAFHGKSFFCNLLASRPEGSMHSAYSRRYFPSPTMLQSTVF